MAKDGMGKGGKSRPVTRSAHRRRMWATGLGIAVVVAAIVGYFAYRAVADLPGVKLEDQGNAHIQMASEPHSPYNSDPPTSGPHLPYIAPWGIHTEPIARELQVHNLEDGGVVVQYRCATPCPELAAKLAEIVRRYETQVILAPYPEMHTRIALTAWTRLDAFDDFDEARIVRFIRAYRGIDHHKG
ncbi:MAG TPA: DUF3105 domain-containing protein [Methylomirabilota bacterium]|jgi:hypothetical protein|nr:DUF3105 domain-containing protein [Methylomirabilota bacterium]